MPFAGKKQKGYGPEDWGITLGQMKALTTQQGFKPDMTVRTLVETIVKPMTLDGGTGLALKLNPCGLRTTKMVSHFWDENYLQFLASLQSTGASDTDAFWVCAFSIFQYDKAAMERSGIRHDVGPTIGEQLGEDVNKGPFAAVIEQATDMYCVFTPGGFYHRDAKAGALGEGGSATGKVNEYLSGNLYTRSWCVLEMLHAMQAGADKCRIHLCLSPLGKNLGEYLGLARLFPSSTVTLKDPQTGEVTALTDRQIKQLTLQAILQPIDSRTSTCNGDDNAKIHSVLEKFGYDKIDTYVAGLRREIVNERARAPREDDPVDWDAVQMALARDDAKIRSFKGTVRSIIAANRLSGS
jgi:hypothetical protein